MSKSVDMHDAELTRIKEFTLIALFSDDDLVERLVLKGGNALAIAHNIQSRASIDLDFSMEGKFDPSELDDVLGRIDRRLSETFRPEGYKVFDVKIEERPKKITPDLVDFWGGYALEFKLIETDKFHTLGTNLDAIRRNAIPVAPGHRTRFEIDISNFEICSSKQAFDLHGYTIFVYTPEMIICEKLRAICQQMECYRKLVKNYAAPRARDFLDIHTVAKHFNIDLYTKSNLQLLGSVFHAKRVPIELIGRISEYYDFHLTEWPAVQSTVYPEFDLQDFDFYFNYVVNLGNSLKSIGNM